MGIGVMQERGGARKEDSRGDWEVAEERGCIAGEEGCRELRE